MWKWITEELTVADFEQENKIEISIKQLLVFEK